MLNIQCDILLLYLAARLEARADLERIPQLQQVLEVLAATEKFTLTRNGPHSRWRILETRC